MSSLKSFIRNNSIVFLSILCFIIYFSSIGFAESPGPKILIVADAGNKNGDYVSYYNNSLWNNSYRSPEDYDIEFVSDSDNGPSNETMSEYDIVIWFTGEEKQNTFKDDDLVELAHYLDAGGSLFLSSAHLMNERCKSKTSFFNDYLNVECENRFGYWDNKKIYVLDTNNPIFNLRIRLDDDIHGDDRVSRTFSFNITNKFSIFYFYNSVNHPISQASWTQTSKVVYFGIPFEIIIDYDNGGSQTSNDILRENLMKNIINYLYTPRTTIDDITPNRTKDNITVNITCDYKNNLTDKSILSVNASEYYFDNNVSGVGNNKNLDAIDGDFDTSTEDISITINTTLAGLNDGNHTIYIRCQDNFGHWGKTDNMTFYINRTAPKTPTITINNTAGFSNTDNVSINVSELLGSGVQSIAFSCDDSNFTEDRPIPFTVNSYNSYFNITNTIYGCSEGDGNRTIYIRAKSETLVENITHNHDNITLDRIAPTFILINVSDSDIIYKSDDTISFNLTMNEAGLDLTANLSEISLTESYVEFSDNDDKTYNYTMNLIELSELEADGDKYITITAMDLAGNIKINSSFFVTIDTTKPNIPIITIENTDGYTNDVTPTIEYDLSNNLPNFISFSCDNLNFTDWVIITLNHDLTTNINTIASTNFFNITNTTYGCLTSDGNRTIYIRSKDIAGNINTSSLNDTVILDTTIPYITSMLPTNNTNITDAISFFVNITDNLFFSNMSYRTTSSTYSDPHSKDTSNKTSASYNLPSLFDGATDGIKYIYFKLEDKVNEIIDIIYSYNLDNSGPITNNNYTYIECQATDVQVNLSCSDEGSGCNATTYCIADKNANACTPSINYTTPITITCLAGTLCEKRIYYHSSDILGNIEEVNETDIIRIDKKPPIINIQNPINSKTYASILDIYTTISDEEGCTVNFANFSINNTIANGSLNITGGWDSTWNSSGYDGVFNITIFANDSLGNSNISTLFFNIDNSKPSATIHKPQQDLYLNGTTPLELYLVGQKDNNNIENCSYVIYNSTNLSLNYSEIIGVSNKECNFTNNVSISTWSEGNYSINFTVNDTLNNITETSDFYIDKTPPALIINISLNGTWISGDIKIEYNATDNIEVLQCIIESKKNITAEWSTDLIIRDCDENEEYYFQTNGLNSKCQDTNNKECLIKVTVIDLAGNTNSSILEFNVDNSPPNIDILTPNTGDYFNSNFNITHNETDPQGQTCSYQINTTSSATEWFDINCDENITIDVGTYCSASGAMCKVHINSTNNVNFSTTKTLSFFVDYDGPILNNINILPDTIVNFGKIIKFNVTATDGRRLVDYISAEILNTSYDVVDTIILDKIGVLDIYNGTYTLSGTDTGLYTINITANDSLGNIAYDDSTTFSVKNTAPNVSNYNLSLGIDSVYGERRIIFGNSLEFSVNITDTLWVANAILTVKPSGYPEKNYTLQPINDNHTDDIWTTTITDTFNETTYSISSLYVNDTLGNVNFTNESTINLSFVSVIPYTEISLETIGNNVTRAGTDTTFNLTLNFNKTVDAGSVRIYFPPNTPSDYDNSPIYFNKSTYSCVVSSGTCSIDYTNDSLNNILYLDLNFNSPIQNITLITQNITSKIISNDTVYNWSMVYDNINYGNSSKIITPSLNITSIFCNDVYPCEIDQNVTFNISVNLTNEQIALNHTGNAYNVSINYSFNGLENTSNVGDIMSGAYSKNKILETLIKTPGNYQLTVNVTDNLSSEYTDFKTYTIKIKDTTSPEYLSELTVNSTQIYKNTTKTFDYNLADNVGIDSVWATILRSDTTKENTTLVLYQTQSGYTIWQLNYDNTSDAGTYNITKIYANDSENNVLEKDINYPFEVKDMNITTTLNSSTHIVLDTLLINTTIEYNISEIESVIANITKPRGENEIVTLSKINQNNTNITIFSGIYQNISQSGTYTINITASAGGNLSKEFTFFTEYGNATIISAIGINDSISIPVAKVYNHSWFIYPVNGDLVDVNITLNISNETVLNLSSIETSLKSFGNLTYENYKDGLHVYWELNSTQKGISNITLNVTSAYSNITQKVQINVTDADSDNTAPIIHNITANKILNRLETEDISVNVTDNHVIKSVIVEVTKQDLTKTNISAYMSGIGVYTADFTNTTLLGNYSYVIYVSDTSDNIITNSSNLAFNVTDKYSVIIKPQYTMYNKGETINVDVLVYNANNKSVDAFNMSMDLTKTTLTNLVENKLQSSVQYQISANDPPKASENEFFEYTFYSNVSKNGNFGNATTYVNITEYLKSSFVSVSQGQYSAPGSIIPLEIEVTNIRGDSISDPNVFAYLGCNGCSNKKIVMYYASNNIYYNYESIISPNSNFVLYVDAIDSYTNGEIINDNSWIAITTTPPTNTETSGGSSSGGMVGAISDTISDIIAQIFPPDEEDFVFSTDTPKITLLTGETIELIYSVENTGDYKIYVDINTELDFGAVSTIDKIPLNVNERKTIPLTINSTLIDISNEYKLKIYLNTKNVSKEYTIIVNLEDNPAVLTLKHLQQEYATLRTIVNEMNFLGIDTATYELYLSNSKILISNAQKAILQNDAVELKSLNSQLDTYITVLDTQLDNKKTLKWILENKYDLAGLLISILLLLYILQGFIVPFISLTMELKDLREKEIEIASEEKSTEKEYFTRVIDKISFRKIMTEKHKELIDVRTHIKQLGLMRTKILHGHPIYSDEIENDNKINDTMKKKLMKNFNKKSAVVPRNAVSLYHTIKENNVAKKQMKQESIISGVSNKIDKLQDEIMSDVFAESVKVSADQTESIVSGNKPKISESEQSLESIEPSASLSPEPTSTSTFQSSEPEHTKISDDDIKDEEFKRILKEIKKDIGD